MTAQVCATNERLIRACPTSLMLFTNTLRGVRHRSGSASTSACIVTPNPGPLVRESPSRLATICLNTIQPADPALPSFRLVTTPTPIQRRALDLLGVSHRLGTT
jgi:hypothetical protein